MSDPRRDRAAARTWIDEAKTEGLFLPTSTYDRHYIYCVFIPLHFSTAFHCSGVSATERGCAPTNGPIIPRSSKASISLAARAYPNLSFRCNNDVDASPCSTTTDIASINNGSSTSSSVLLLDTGVTLDSDLFFRCTLRRIDSSLFSKASMLIRTRSPSPFFVIYIG